MGKERIKITDTVEQVIATLSDRNPGALRVLCELSSTGPTIDPDARALAPIAAMLDLDMMGIYGSDIWLLYKDICQSDITNMHAVLRGVQLGIVGRDAVTSAIHKASCGAEVTLDVAAILTAVKKRLLAFGRTIEGK